MLAALAQEPDGTIRPKNIRELEGILKALELGVISGPLRPATHDSHDVVDGIYQEWDIKQLQSEYWPADINAELDKWERNDLPHENILIDTTYMSEENIVELRNAIVARPEFADRYRFSPPLSN